MIVSALGRQFGAFAFCGVLSLASAASALAQHGDVWLRQQNGAVGLGVVDEAGTSYTPGIRALEVILTPDSLPFSPFDDSAEDPGFRAEAGQLPPSQPMNLSLVSLRKWNGVGLAPAIGVSFAFDLSNGFSTEADGSLHEHPLYGLTDLTADAQPIPDGVYVAAFRVSTAGLIASDLEYFVMLKDGLVGDETNAEDLTGLLEGFENGGPAPVFMGKDFTFFDQVYDFVAGAIPEPSGAALGAVGLLGLLLRLRK